MKEKGPGAQEPITGYTLLHKAAMSSGVGAIHSFVSENIPLEARDSFGRTALHVAVEHGNPFAVNGLACAGADIEARDNEGRTPLLLAAQTRYEPVISELLHCGADRTARLPNGQTAEDICRKDGHIVLAELIRRKPQRDVGR